ncbi:MAG: two component transcriptional regulator, LuxR family [Bryobacterales bacterium]|nr:two component transcriptional regulator, LuxR family [Bryobacterales bacterium]
MSSSLQKKITVLVCDDHALFREGVKTILNSQPDIEVVGEAADGKEGVEQAIRLYPDVVLMDISMPVLKGFEAVRRIKKARPDIKILILTVYDDEDMVARCLDAGAAGYVLKDSPPLQLVYAIQTVHHGQQYMSPRVLTGVVRQYISQPADFRGGYELLSDREREILVLLAEGQSLKDIATRLNLSVKTVDAHKYNLMRKLDLHDRSELIRYAIRKRLVEA